MPLSLNKQIFIGAGLGILAGLILGHAGLPAETTAPWLSVFEFLGRTFISILKLIVIPLIFVSVANGIANLQHSTRLHRVWPVLILYAVITAGLASVTGLLAVNIFKPGQGLDITLFKADMDTFQAKSTSFQEFFPQILHNIFSNPFHAVITGNIVAIVFFAIMLGIIINVLGPKARVVHTGLNTLFQWIMTIVLWIMRLAPFGVMGLLAKLVAGQSPALLGVLVKYMAVVFATTIFHGAITLPLILWLVTRMSPLHFFKSMKDAFITAFSTSSSSATLPITMRCVTDNLKVDKHTAGFVLPVAGVLNMDGTALYEAIAALFIANLCGIELNMAQQVTVALTAMLASVGAPGIPSAGMVTMILVLQSVGLPAEAVAILIPIDRPLDTVRTVANVEGDAIGACVVDHMNKA